MPSTVPHFLVNIKEVKGKEVLLNRMVVAQLKLS